MIGVVLSGDVTANTIESVAHGLMATNTVRVSPYGPTLPGGLAVGTTYFVIASGLTADAFKVSLTSGGSAVDITSEGAFFVVPTSGPVTYPAGSVCISDDVGTLVVGGTSLNTPAWGILDLSDLWAILPPLKGNNVPLPESPGQRAYPRRFNQQVVSLPMDVSGICDQTGALYGNDEIGLETNLAYLFANVFDPPTPPTATRAGVLTMPSGASRTANVQVTDFHRREIKTRGLYRALVEFTIPRGRFV